MAKDFLPVCRQDLDERNIDEVDFVFVSADAYVDHATFAAALLGRLLESHGYTVAILAQPDWHSAESFKVFGRPKLGFLVSGGAMDSMVSNYTANNKPRSEDVYSHGGVAGHRPDRAIIAYVSKIREAYKGVSVIIGGIEASLRRTSHYDYWSNTVKRSILLDSKADLLIYGMGEHALLEIAGRLKSGCCAREIRDVKGTCWFTGKESELPEYVDAIPDYVKAYEEGKAEPPHEYNPKKAGQKLKPVPVICGDVPISKALMLPPFQDVSKNTAESKELFARSYIIQEQNTDALNAHVLIEKADSRFVIQNPAALPLTTEEFDKIYSLPFTRKWHPMYDAPAENGKTGIPALSEVKFSLTSCRGCYGACSFCAITFHQGRRIQTRSHESLLAEAKQITEEPDFKGYIHDVGGPTANFRKDACPYQKQRGACKNKDCLGTNPCPNVVVDHSDYVELLKKMRQLPKVKKVFIRSGIRFDYLVMDKDKSFFRELCEHHISGQLKVAPEHVSDSVLRLMRKSSHKVYEEFSKEYEKINRELGKKQYLVPYYIAGHPGAGLNEAIDVALYLKKTGFVPDQVQDFYPTPGSLATCMYYTGFNPANETEDGHLEPVYVARGGRERRLQRALLQFNHPGNKPLVIEALKQAGRMDLLKVFY
ncbi:MAG: YgiQ family radical SAM protein [Treponema sp.]|nr:YgiQ family radical SAM protein [Treponema sp.]MBQ5384761.1 YgiQ family radical SAM protein [Treponema sp.]